jgi:hypothetical protein
MDPIDKFLFLNFTRVSEFTRVGEFEDCYGALEPTEDTNNLEINYSRLEPVVDNIAGLGVAVRITFSDDSTPEYIQRVKTRVEEALEGYKGKTYTVFVKKGN